MDVGEAWLYVWDSRESEVELELGDVDIDLREGFNTPLATKGLGTQIGAVGEV